jgi:hypothetical protein
MQMPQTRDAIKAAPPSIVIHALLMDLLNLVEYFSFLTTPLLVTMLKLPSDSPGYMQEDRWCFSVGGVLLEVEADLPLTAKSFHPQLMKFRSTPFSETTVKIHHHFFLPKERPFSGRIWYDRLPWRIAFDGNTWIYQQMNRFTEPPPIIIMGVFSSDHFEGDIYHPDSADFERRGLGSITKLASDQIVLSRVLADREGCILHSSGMEISGQGLLFAGHSSAGKSTITRMLQSSGNILCDDRIIIRRWPDEYRIYGTISHGEIPIVSPGPAPLRAIMLLEKADENRMTRMDDHRELARILPFLVIKPLVTADWWGKTFDLLEKIIRDVPVYRLRFDKSGRVADLIHDFLAGKAG